MELEVNRYLHYLEIARLCRRAAASPPVELIGLPHLQDALLDGRGVILFIGHFVHNGLAPKVGLARAGHPVTHLSRPEHGFSKTRFGIRFLNPVRRRVEDRYLKHRAVISAESPVPALRQLVQDLSQNGVVSITAGAWEGTRIMDIPLMGSSYPIATGAFSLARLSGAPILPLIALRAEPSGTLTVIIEPPLLDRSKGDRKQSMLAMGADAVASFAPYIERVPGQFRGWSYLEPAALRIVPSTAGK
jgi:lauroyl/myristoyl acyltransferase